MLPEAGPLARALLALELIQARPGITAEQLAGNLGVSERAVRRCIGTLREAGVPIESRSGPYGGYRAGRGLRLPPLTFTAAEALSLVMAVLDGHHDAADPAGLVGRALGKITRALPEQVAVRAEAVRLATAAAPDRTAARPDPDTVTALVEACSQTRRTRLAYRSEAGRQRDLDVDPWAVVVRHARWYLLCWSHTSDARRAYRIDRIGSVELLATAFDPPPADLDPVAALEEHLAAGWKYTTEVIIQAPIGAVAAQCPRVLGTLEPLDPDSCRLTGTTGNPYWYVQQLTAIPVPYRIVGGPELRHVANELGRRLLDATA